MSKTGDQKRKAPAFLPDDWRLVENGFTPDTQAVSETLMAQANGYLGTRGTFEEGVADGIRSTEGTYLNGVYLRDPIHYDEAAFGFASHNNKMILVPDGKAFDLTAGDERFIQGASKLDGQSRVLDMRDGMLSRTSRWQTRTGGTLEINSRRFVSMAAPGLMVIDYTLASVDYTGPVSLTTGLNTRYGGGHEGFDPRAGELSVAACLEKPEAADRDGATLIAHRVRHSGHLVLAGYRVDYSGDTDIGAQDIREDGLWATRLDAALAPGQEITVRKYVAYADFEKGTQRARWSALGENLGTMAQKGFDALYKDHKAVWDAFWDTADVTVDSDDPVEQGIRFGAFHLFQSAGKDGGRALAAKGLSGPGYDGHYFWDTEIYAVPFFLFNAPEVARSLIEYRISTLDAARARAREMGHTKGALFPWRTIGGEECSSFFPAGTAQYHINAAIAYALIQYVNISGDKELLAGGGAEMLFETARIWMDLGHFNAQKGGAFCIHEVTGPDEYTAMVDNNLYTNLMAQQHLAEAAALAKSYSKQDFDAIAAKIDLSQDEVAAWQKAADCMYVPFDENLGIHAQCDGFLDKPEWDFDGTPAENYPLLLHYHPLVIYRHQVLKQPDVVLAQILLPARFTADEKARNLAYYEPRTTHDSTLSACIHAVANLESGDPAKAYEFFEETYRMDLENRHANTHYGNHMACMAGSWMALVYGFGGLRLEGALPALKPALPDGWRSYSFKLRLGAGLLKLSVSADSTDYQYDGPDPVIFHHYGHRVALKPKEQISLPNQ
ncbi:glycoside hydrolase family 65 protein [Kordiimonas lacus]|uniref:Alpha,alpha-trehalose phosphorylase n=1 Tax=Kordiimonas lacus TaxID=637679 RepID=A0A1G6U699_9PROT|nr:glycosyl hydrolase family 65 protein [Kordiimonas lacus]SDD36910.1 alpha,alpha-trehalose phosphorylase [Kordiimonas lacus]